MRSGQDASHDFPCGLVVECLVIEVMGWRWAEVPCQIHMLPFWLCCSRQAVACGQYINQEGQAPLGVVDVNPDMDAFDVAQDVLDQLFAGTS